MKGIFPASWSGLGGWTEVEPDSRRRRRNRKELRLGLAPAVGVSVPGMWVTQPTGRGAAQAAAAPEGAGPGPTGSQTQSRRTGPGEESQSPCVPTCGCLVRTPPRTQQPRAGRGAMAGLGESSMSVLERLLANAALRDETGRLRSPEPQEPRTQPPSGVSQGV